MRPSRNQFACPTRSPLGTWEFQLKVWPSPGTAKCPEPLCPQPVLPTAARRHAPCRRALPLLPRSYGLMRQTKFLRPTSWTYFGRSRQVAVSPCWEMALPDVISAVCVKTPGPLPRRVPAIQPICVPFLTGQDTLIAGHRPRPRTDKRGTPNLLCPATSTEGVFRGCSHSLMFRLLHSLGPQVAPTAVLSTGQPGRLPHAMLLRLHARAVISLRT